MTATTSARDDKRQDGDLVAVPVEAGEIIYAGTIITCDTDGYGMPGADTANFTFGGVAADTVDNTGGADGAKKVAAYREGVHEFAYSGTATQADINKSVYVVDNQTVALVGVTSADVLVGKIVEVIDASTVRVKI